MAVQSVLGGLINWLTPLVTGIILIQGIKENGNCTYKASAAMQLLRGKLNRLAFHKILPVRSGSQSEGWNQVTWFAASL